MPKNAPLTKIVVPYKKTDFRPKIRNFWPKKKGSLSTPNHVPAITEQSCENKKVPFSQINGSLLAVLGLLFSKKLIFGPFCNILQFLAKRKIGRFSVFSIRTASVFNQDYFLGDPDYLTEFHRSRVKIRGTCPSELGIAKNGQNPARRPENGPPSGQTATYRKTKGIQSYVRMWGWNVSIKLSPPEPKKWGLYGCSVKKWGFFKQKWALAPAQTPIVQRWQHKKGAFLGSSHDGTKKNGWWFQKMDLGPKTAFLTQK